MRRFLLSGVAAAAIGIIVQDPAQSAPLYNWTGCYIGGNVGGGWSSNKFDPNNTIAFEGGTAHASGVVGGAQLGCDVQSGMLVFGVQGLFDWASMRAESPFFAGKNFRAHTPWFATVSGRVGYAAQPNMIVFVRGGAAFVRDQYTFFHSFTATETVTRTGALVGGGFEWMFAPNLSVTVEYGFMGFGNKSVTFNALGLGSENVHQQVQVVLVGLNYRFGTGGR
jgi:outer membrane immunogenic protein